MVDTDRGITSCAVDSAFRKLGAGLTARDTVRVVSMVTTVKIWYSLSTAMTSARDPYPFPRLENDEKFVGSPGKKCSPCSGSWNPAEDHLKLKPGEPDPWQRLNSTKTLSSHRRDVYYYDPQAPHDSLDFVLKCQYDHHQEFMKSRAETLMQPETAGLDHGRVLKNRPKVPEPETLETKALVTHLEPKKTSIHSSKGLAIESHHSEATNRGYSRKHDGGFYST